MSELTPESKFSPMTFRDGNVVTTYTALEVEAVCIDYLTKAEQSVEQRRQNSKATQRFKKGVDQKDGDVIELDAMQRIVAQVNENGDYNWIVAKALVRGEIDPLHSLRVKMYTRTREGGSTVDIMTAHIDDVFRKIDSSYVERARAKDMLSMLEILNKKYSPPIPSPTFALQLGIVNNLPGAKEPANPELPLKVVTVTDLRKKTMHTEGKK